MPNYTKRILLMSAACFSAALLVFAAAPLHATRIQELVQIEGVRDNQLVGYGIVVGLNGTGDSGQARFTIQSVASALRRLNVMVDPATIQTKNAAAVIVTTIIPPFSSPGTAIDVVVSSIGNARSLQGGTLIQTPLYGADRNVYAVSQGSVLVGGFSASGASGSSESSNHVTAGRIPNGALVERRIPVPSLENQEHINLLLRDPSFTTASRIANRINETLGAGTAAATNGGVIQLNIPAAQRRNPVELIASIHALEVQPGASARVVVNENNGTVIVGTEVRISEVAIAQGGLSVSISESLSVSQPNALGGGGTAVVPETNISVEDRAQALRTMPPSASLSDVVSALNALGATPRELISILQALKAAGALQADLIVQ